MSWADTGSTDDRALRARSSRGDPAATTVADVAGSLRDGVAASFTPATAAGGAASA